MNFKFNEKDTVEVKEYPGSRYKIMRFDYSEQYKVNLYKLDDKHWYNEAQLKLIDRPKAFKVGDVVRITNNTFDKSTTKITKVKGYRDTDIQDSEDQIWSLNYHLVLVELWEPKQGDICIFYNDNFSSLRISKFKQIAWGKNIAGKYKDYQSNYYNFCEPYIKENLDNLVQKIQEKELK